MKRRRFEDLHRNAIRWPRDRFGYVGVDLEGDTTASYSGEVRSFSADVLNPYIDEEIEDEWISAI